MEKLILFDIDHTLINNYPLYFPLHPDVLPILKYLSQKGYSLGLFSQSLAFWQRLKLQSNNIYQLFDPKFQFISLNKVRLLKKSLPALSHLEIHVVDDRLDILSKLDSLPVKTHWINRRNKKSQRSSIHTLTELTNHF